MDRKLGYLIAIEGGDGSGKKTQTKMLLDFLSENKISFQTFDFPQYESFYGKLIAKYLRGEFGTLEEVSPYFAAGLFALDRFQVRDKIIKSVKTNAVTVANRYVPSNIAHQGGKFSNLEDRNKFIKWTCNLEYDIYGLPKEDVVVYLKIPSKISKSLMENRKNRKYLQGEEDIQENNDKHLFDTQMMYNILSQKDKNWIVIECTTNGRMKSKTEIHELILKELKQRNII